MSDERTPDLLFPPTSRRLAVKRVDDRLRDQEWATAERNLARAIRERWQTRRDEIELSAYVQKFSRTDQFLMQVVLVRELGVETARRVCALAGSSFRLVPEGQRARTPSRAELESLKRAEAIVRRITGELSDGVPLYAANLAVQNLIAAPVAVRQSALMLLARRQSAPELSTLAHLNLVVRAASKPESFSLEKAALENSFGAEARDVEIEYGSPVVAGAKGATVDGKVHVPWRRGQRLSQDELKTLGHEVPHALQQRRGQHASHRWLSASKRRRLETEARHASRAFLRGERFDVRGRAPQAVALYRGKKTGGGGAQVTFSEIHDLKVVRPSGADVTIADGQLKLFKVEGSTLRKEWLRPDARVPIRFVWSCVRIERVDDDFSREESDELKGHFRGKEELAFESPSTILNREVGTVTQHERQINRYAGFRFRKEGTYDVSCEVQTFQNGAWGTSYETSETIAVRSVQWAQERFLQKGKGQQKSYSDFVAGKKRELQKNQWDGYLLKETKTVQGDSAWLVRYDKPVASGYRSQENTWFRVEGLKPLEAGKRYQFHWDIKKSGGGAQAVKEMDTRTLDPAQAHHKAEDRQTHRLQIVQFLETGEYQVGCAVSVVDAQGHVEYLTNASNQLKEQWLTKTIEVSAKVGHRQQGVVSTAANPAVAIGYPRDAADLHQKYMVGYRLGQKSPNATYRKWLVAWKEMPESVPKDYWGSKAIPVGQWYPSLKDVSLDSEVKGESGKLGGQTAYEVSEGQAETMWFPMLEKNWTALKGTNTMYVVCAEMTGQNELVKAHVFTQKLLSEGKAAEAQNKTDGKRAANQEESVYLKGLNEIRSRLMEEPKPLNAVYVNYQEMKCVALPLFYARNNDGKMVLVDATPGAEKTRREYVGAGSSVADAIAAFSSVGWGAHDFYPQGEILIQQPGLGAQSVQMQGQNRPASEMVKDAKAGAKQVYQTIQTLGETTFAKWLSLTGLASMVLGVAAAALTITGVGAPIAVAMIGLAAGAAGLASMAGELYNESQSVEGITGESAMISAISLAASIVGLGQATKGAVQAGKAVFKMAKSAKYAEQAASLLTRLAQAAGNAEGQTAQLGKTAAASMRLAAMRGKSVAQIQHMAELAHNGILVINTVDMTISTAKMGDQLVDQIQAIMNGEGTTQQKLNKIAEMLGRSATDIAMMVINHKDTAQTIKHAMGAQHVTRIPLPGTLPHGATAPEHEHNVVGQKVKKVIAGEAPTELGLGDAKQRIEAGKRRQQVRRGAAQQQGIGPSLKPQHEPGDAYFVFSKEVREQVGEPYEVIGVKPAGNGQVAVTVSGPKGWTVVKMNEHGPEGPTARPTQHAAPITVRPGDGASAEPYAGPGISVENVNAPILVQPMDVPISALPMRSSGPHELISGDINFDALRAHGNQPIGEYNPNRIYSGGAKPDVHAHIEDARVSLDHINELTPQQWQHWEASAAVERLTQTQDVRPLTTLLRGQSAAPGTIFIVPHPDGHPDHVAYVLFHGMGADGTIQLNSISEREAQALFADRGSYRREDWVAPSDPSARSASSAPWYERGPEAIAAHIAGRKYVLSTEELHHILSENGITIQDRHYASRLREVIALIEQGPDRFSRNVAGRMRTQLAERMHVLPREELVALAASLGYRLEAGTMGGFEYGGHIFMSADKTTQSMALTAFHEALHAFGQGELRAWMRTTRLAESLGILAHAGNVEQQIHAIIEQARPVGQQEAYYYVLALQQIYSAPEVFFSQLVNPQGQLEIIHRIQAIATDSNRAYQTRRPALLRNQDPAWQEWNRDRIRENTASRGTPNTGSPANVQPEVHPRVEDAVVKLALQPGAVKTALTELPKAEVPADAKHIGTSDDGRKIYLIDAENDHYVDEHGRRVDEDGYYRNAEGRLTDVYGRRVNYGGELLDSAGRVINEDGHLIDKQGRLINEAGKWVNGKGELLDSRGYLMSEKPPAGLVAERELSQGSGGISEIFLTTDEHGQKMVVKCDPQLGFRESEVEIVIALEKYGGPKYLGKKEIRDPNGLWKEGLGIELVQGADANKILWASDAGRDLPIKITDEHIRSFEHMLEQIAADGKVLTEVNPGDFILTHDGRVTPIDMFVEDAAGRKAPAIAQEVLARLKAAKAKQDGKQGSNPIHNSEVHPHVEDVSVDLALQNRSPGGPTTPGHAIIDHRSSDRFVGANIDGWEQIQHSTDLSAISAFVAQQAGTSSFDQNVQLLIARLHPDVVTPELRRQLEQYLKPAQGNGRPFDLATGNSGQLHAPSNSGVTVETGLEVVSHNQAVAHFAKEKSGDRKKQDILKDAPIASLLEKMGIEVTEKNASGVGYIVEDLNAPEFNKPLDAWTLRIVGSEAKQNMGDGISGKTRSWVANTSDTRTKLEKASWGDHHAIQQGAVALQGAGLSIEVVVTHPKMQGLARRLGVLVPGDLSPGDFFELVKEIGSKVSKRTLEGPHGLDEARKIAAEKKTSLENPGLRGRSQQTDGFHTTPVDGDLRFMSAPYNAGLKEKYENFKMGFGKRVDLIKELQKGDVVVPKSKSTGERTADGQLIYEKDWHLTADMLAEISYLTNEEVVVVILKNGDRVLRLGQTVDGKKVVNADTSPDGDVKRIVAHTHLDGTVMLSPEDVAELSRAGQKSHVVIAAATGEAGRLKVGKTETTPEANGQLAAPSNHKVVEPRPDLYNQIPDRIDATTLGLSSNIEVVHDTSEPGKIITEVFATSASGEKQRIGIMNRRVENTSDGKELVLHYADLKQSPQFADGSVAPTLPTKAAIDGVPSITEDGTPLGSLLTMYQMKRLGVQYGELASVKLEDVTDRMTTAELAIAQRNWRQENPGQPVTDEVRSQLIRETHSFQYVERIITMTGHKVTDVRLVGGNPGQMGSAGPGWNEDPGHVKKYLALLEQHGIDPRESGLQHFEIHIDVEPIERKDKRVRTRQQTEKSSQVSDAIKTANRKLTKIFGGDPQPGSIISVNAEKTYEGRFVEVDRDGLIWIETTSPKVGLVALDGDSVYGGKLIESATIVQQHLVASRPNGQVNGNGHFKDAFGSFETELGRTFTSEQFLTVVRRHPEMLQELQGRGIVNEAGNLNDQAFGHLKGSKPDLLAQAAFNVLAGRAMVPGVKLDVPAPKAAAPTPSQPTSTPAVAPKHVQPEPTVYASTRREYTADVNGVTIIYGEGKLAHEARPELNPGILAIINQAAPGSKVKITEVTLPDGTACFRGVIDGNNYVADGQGHLEPTSSLANLRSIIESLPDGAQSVSIHQVPHDDYLGQPVIMVTVDGHTLPPYDVHGKPIAYPGGGGTGTGRHDDWVDRRTKPTNLPPGGAAGDNTGVRLTGPLANAPEGGSGQKQTSGNIKVQFADQVELWVQTDPNRPPERVTGFVERIADRGTASRTARYDMEVAQQDTLIIRDYGEIKHISVTDIVSSRVSRSATPQEKQQYLIDHPYLAGQMMANAAASPGENYFDNTYHIAYDGAAARQATTAFQAWDSNFSVLSVGREYTRLAGIVGLASEKGPIYLIGDPHDVGDHGKNIPVFSSEMTTGYIVPHAKTLLHVYQIARDWMKQNDHRYTADPKRASELYEYLDTVILQDFMFAYDQSTFDLMHQVVKGDPGVRDRLAKLLVLETDSVVKHVMQFIEFQERGRWQMGFFENRAKQKLKQALEAEIGKVKNPTEQDIERMIIEARERILTITVREAEKKSVALPTAAKPTSTAEVGRQNSPKEGSSPAAASPKEVLGFSTEGRGGATTQTGSTGQTPHQTQSGAAPSNQNSGNSTLRGGSGGIPGQVLLRTVENNYRIVGSKTENACAAACIAALANEQPAEGAPQTVTNLREAKMLVGQSQVATSAEAAGQLQLKQGGATTQDVVAKLNQWSPARTPPYAKSDAPAMVWQAVGLKGAQAFSILVEQAKPPFMVLLKSDGGNHWVIVRHVDSAEVIFDDPFVTGNQTHGDRKMLPHDQFAALFQDGVYQAPVQRGGFVAPRRTVELRQSQPGTLDDANRTRPLETQPLAPFRNDDLVNQAMAERGIPADILDRPDAVSIIQQSSLPEKTKEKLRELAFIRQSLPTEGREDLFRSLGYGFDEHGKISSLPTNEVGVEVLQRIFDTSGVGIRVIGGAFHYTETQFVDAMARHELLFTDRIHDGAFHLSGISTLRDAALWDGMARGAAAIRDVRQLLVAHLQAQRINPDSLLNDFRTKVDKPFAVAFDGATASLTSNGDAEFNAGMLIVSDSQVNRIRTEIQRILARPEFNGDRSGLLTQVENIISGHMANYTAPTAAGVGQTIERVWGGTPARLGGSVKPTEHLVPSTQRVVNAPVQPTRPLQAHTGGDPLGTQRLPDLSTQRLPAIVSTPVYVPETRLLPSPYGWAGGSVAPTAAHAKTLEILAGYDARIHAGLTKEKIKLLPGGHVEFVGDRPFKSSDSDIQNHPIFLGINEAVAANAKAEAHKPASQQRFQNKADIQRSALGTARESSKAKLMNFAAEVRRDAIASGQTNTDTPPPVLANNAGTGVLGVHGVLPSAQNVAPIARDLQGAETARDLVPNATPDTVRDLLPNGPETVRDLNLSDAPVTQTDLVPAIPVPPVPPPITPQTDSPQLAAAKARAKAELQTPEGQHALAKQNRLGKRKIEVRGNRFYQGDWVVVSREGAAPLRGQIQSASYNSVAIRGVGNKTLSIPIQNVSGITRIDLELSERTAIHQLAPNAQLTLGFDAHGDVIVVANTGDTTRYFYRNGREIDRATAGGGGKAVGPELARANIRPGTGAEEPVTTGTSGTVRFEQGDKAHSLLESIDGDKNYGGANKTAFAQLFDLGEQLTFSVADETTGFRAKQVELSDTDFGMLAHDIRTAMQDQHVSVEDPFWFGVVRAQVVSARKTGLRFVEVDSFRFDPKAEAARQKTAEGASAADRKEGAAKVRERAKSIVNTVRTVNQAWVHADHLASPTEKPAHQMAVFTAVRETVNALGGDDAHFAVAALHPQVQALFPGITGVKLATLVKRVNETTYKSTKSGPILSGVVLQGQSGYEPLVLSRMANALDANGSFTNEADFLRWVENTAALRLQLAAGQGNDRTTINALHDAGTSYLELSRHPYIDAVRRQHRLESPASEADAKALVDMVLDEVRGSLFAHCQAMAVPVRDAEPALPSNVTRVNFAASKPASDAAPSQKPKPVIIDTPVTIPVNFAGYKIMGPEADRVAKLSAGVRLQVVVARSLREQVGTTHPMIMMTAQEFVDFLGSHNNVWGSYRCENGVHQAKLLKGGYRDAAAVEWPKMAVDGTKIPKSHNYDLHDADGVPLRAGQRAPKPNDRRENCPESVIAFIDAYKSGGSDVSPLPGVRSMTLKEIQDNFGGQANWWWLPKENDNIEGVYADLAKHPPGTIAVVHCSHTRQLTQPITNRRGRKFYSVTDAHVFVAIVQPDGAVKLIDPQRLDPKAGKPTDTISDLQNRVPILEGRHDFGVLIVPSDYHPLKKPVKVERTADADPRGPREPRRTRSGKDGGKPGSAGAEPIHFAGKPLPLGEWYNIWNSAPTITRICDNPDVAAFIAQSGLANHEFLDFITALFGTKASPKLAGQGGLKNLQLTPERLRELGIHEDIIRKLEAVSPENPP